MNYETLAFIKNDDIATIALNRPDVHNAMNETLMQELTSCFQHLVSDSSISVVILTGNGKSFWWIRMRPIIINRDFCSSRLASTHPVMSKNPNEILSPGK